MTLGFEKTMLKDVGLVLAPTHRSRAYVQALLHVGLEPEVCFMLPGQEPEDIAQPMARFDLCGLRNPFYFNANQAARVSAKINGWKVKELPAQDINDVQNLKVLEAENLAFLVYSGMPKALLSSKALGISSKFIHIHGGYLPKYRGATCFYYSLLEAGKIGQSAIVLDEGIDTGSILLRRWYDPLNFGNFDYIFEPITRADLLCRVLLKFSKLGFFEIDAHSDSHHDERQYFVIHPVLKNISLRTLK